MGKRGPKPDPTQAAKGYPGRRRTKADLAAEESSRIAALLAPIAPAVVDVPAMLQDPKYAPAAAVWRRIAPELRRTNRLTAADEFAFMQFCIYAQEWTAHTDDLHSKGFTQKIATVAGGKMERRRPSTFDRQQAFSNGAVLSAKFGLTPVDMYDLFKGQRAAAETNPGLFGKSEPGSPPPPKAEDQAPPASRVGSFGLHRSTPPGERPN